SENMGVANGHTVLRHFRDPSLKGTRQHRYMWEKKKIKPEVGWSQLRRRFAPGFEDILDVGVNMGWYDPKALLEACVNQLFGLKFRWVFIQWLQSELDSY
ncbi:hypothetical protein FB45DRAFT_673182, partial [Roridomyces roridus]